MHDPVRRVLSDLHLGRDRSGERLDDPCRRGQEAAVVADGRVSGLPSPARILHVPVAVTVSPRVTTDFLRAQRATIVDRAAAVLGESRARHYDSIGPELRRNRLEVLYDRIVAAADSRDLGDVLTFARELAEERFSAGYDLSEIQVAVNILEEAVWRRIFSELRPDQFADTLVPVSAIFGAVKDALAREYVSLATRAQAPSLDLTKLATGSSLS